MAINNCVPNFRSCSLNTDKSTAIAIWTLQMGKKELKNWLVGKNEWSYDFFP